MSRVSRPCAARVIRCCDAVKSFTVRTTFWFSGLVTTILAVVLAIGGWLLNRQMIAGLELLHLVEARELAEMLGPSSALSSEEIHERIAQDADHDAELFLIQVHDQSGSVRFRSENLGNFVLPEMAGGTPHRTLQVPAVGPVRVSHLVIGPWHVQIGSRLAPTARVLRDYLQVAALLMLGGAAVSVALGWGFSRFTLAPIREIERTARRIGGDNLSERITVPPGRDELAALSRLLNETFDRIEAAFAQVRRFTADASHELKTPLALIRLNTERLRRRLGDDEESADALDDVLEDIERLNQIIENLLFLSKAESGVLQLDQAELRLPDWLHEWGEDAQVLAEDGGVRFELQLRDEGRIAGVPSLLRQVLFNLLANALKFSPPGGRIVLRVTRTATRWQWVMEDEGPGVPSDQLERMFDRFVRYERAEDADRRPGHGLGLAICKSIVELHAGTIRAQNREGRSGLRIEVTLPTL